MFSEVAEIALVAARLGQFQQLLKTRVILILNFTRPRAITYAKRFLNKVNKPSRCHNPRKAWTPLRVFRGNGFIRAILFSRVSPCNRASAMAPRFPFFFPRRLLCFCFPHWWLTPKSLRAENSFPAKLLFASCERWGFRHFIGWRLFVLTCLSDKACHVYKSLEGENSHSFFERVLPV